MNYRIVVTTDGRPGVLDRTLTALQRRVTPQPSEIVVVDDSGDTDYCRYLNALLPTLGIDTYQLVWHTARQGFCATVRDAWREAAKPGPAWVMWVEDDIEIVRQVDLPDLANVLAHEPLVAQMALMRQPVNDREKAAGSLFALYRDRYEQRGIGTVAWLRSTTNFATGCSLMSRSFMEANQWPDYPTECEGRYSIDLLAAGYAFGVWGTGDAWVSHIGNVRAGTGY